MWYHQVQKMKRKELFFVIVDHLAHASRISPCLLSHRNDPGADDDWYWIMPTVVENRLNTAYVVTNDLMRDHRLAFLEPRPFIRWRTTQVMHFDFSKAGKQTLVGNLISAIGNTYFFCVHN